MRYLNLSQRLVFTLTCGVILSACTQSNSDLTIGQGAEGSVLAVGTDVPMTLHEDGFDFKVAVTKTPNISIGTAVGGAKASRNNEAQFFVPASITKVITSALVLKHRGSKFHFTTKVVWDELQAGVAHDVVVYADGDPQESVTGTEKGPARLRTRELAQEFKKHGIKKLDGSFTLVAMDARKDQAIPPEGLDDEDHYNCYGSRAQAFNLYRNCAEFTIDGLASGKWSDSGINTPVTFETQLAGKRSLILKAVYGQYHALIGYKVQGSWSIASSPLPLSIPVADVKSWYGSSILHELGQINVDVSSVIPTQASDDEQTHLRNSMNARAKSFKIDSDPLSLLLKYMNKPSDNFLADTMFRAFAIDGESPEIVQAGIDVLNAGVLEWMTRAGHPEYANEIHLVDGAGLSRSNRVTPRAFLTLLKEISKEPEFPTLWDSLSVAGVDGTLRGRMRGTAAQGLVHGKTGTVRGAYQLVGYVPRKLPGGAREYVPFVILSAAIPSSIWAVHGFQDQVVARLAAQISRQ